MPSTPVQCVQAVNHTATRTPSMQVPVTGAASARTTWAVLQAWSGGQHAQTNSVLLTAKLEIDWDWPTTCKLGDEYGSLQRGSTSTLTRCRTGMYSGTIKGASRRDARLALSSHRSTASVIIIVIANLASATPRPRHPLLHNLLGTAVVSFCPVTRVAGGPYQKRSRRGSEDSHTSRHAS